MLITKILNQTATMTTAIITIVVGTMIMIMIMMTIILLKANRKGGMKIETNRITRKMRNMKKVKSIMINSQTHLIT